MYNCTIGSTILSALYATKVGTMGTSDPCLRYIDLPLILYDNTSHSALNLAPFTSLTKWYLSRLQSCHSEFVPLISETKILEGPSPPLLLAIFFSQSQFQFQSHFFSFSPHPQLPPIVHFFSSISYFSYRPVLDIEYPAQNYRHHLPKTPS